MGRGFQRRGPRLPLGLAGIVGRPGQKKGSTPLSHKERRKEERLARKGGSNKDHDDEVLRKPANSDPHLQRKLAAAVAAGRKAAAQLAGLTSAHKRPRSSETHAERKKSRVSFDKSESRPLAKKSTLPIADEDDSDSEEEEEEVDEYDRGSALDSGSEASSVLDIEDDMASKVGKATSLAAAMGTGPDPYAEEDEKLIAQLERKLGTSKAKSTASKSSKDAAKRLNKEFAKDGLGDDFGDFLSHLDETVLERNKGAGAAEDSEDEHEEDEDDEEEEGEGEADYEEESDDHSEGGEEEDSEGVDGEEEEYVEEMPELIPAATRGKGKRQPIQYAEEEEDDSESGSDDDGGSDEDKDDNEDDADDDDDEEDAEDEGSQQDDVDSNDDEDDENEDDESVSSSAMEPAVPAVAGGKYIPPHLRAKGVEAETTSSRSGSGEGRQAAHIGGDVKKPKQDLYGRDLPASGAAHEPLLLAPAADKAGNSRRAAFNAKGPLAVTVDLTDEKTLLIRRKIQGLLNRLSEANVEAISGEMAGVYKEYAHGTCNAMLLHAIMSALQHEAVLYRPLALVYGALLGALHVLVGPGVGAAAIERLTLYFADCTGLPLLPNPPLAQLLQTQAPPSMRDGEAAARRGEKLSAEPVPAKTRANILLLLCYLLHFQVAHPSLLVQIAALLVARFTEPDVELLLLILTYGGWALRAEDPASLRDILKCVHIKLKESGALPQSGIAADVIASAQAQTQGAKAKAQQKEKATQQSSGASISVLDVLEGGSSASAGGVGVSSSARMRVLGELLLDLKNNRKRGEIEQLLERAQQLRKWLNRLVSSKEASLVGVDRRLRVAWLDIMSIPEVGRWWLVGSSWAGRAAAGAVSKAADAEERSGGRVAVSSEGALTSILGASALVSASGASGAAAGLDPSSDPSAPVSAVAAADARIKASMSEQDAQLYELARAMRMNTPARRSVFVSLMGSEDVPNAVERVLRLDLKGPAEREVIRVMLDCVGQEAGYNRFFAQVTARLCVLKPAMKFTLQLALWDRFKLLDGSDSSASDLLTSRNVYNLARYAAECMLAHTLPSFGAGSLSSGGGKKGKDSGPVLTLGCLKPLPFSAAERGSSPKTLLFIKTLLSSLILEAKTAQALSSVFSKTGTGSDKLLVRDGLVVALHAHVSTSTLTAAAQGHGKAAAGVTQEELKQRLRTARKALESIEGAGVELDDF